MPAKLEEITIVYLGERFRFENPDGDVVIGAARDEAGGEITIKGQADRDELTPYLSYRLYGRWSNYTNRKTGVEEQQFHFQTFVKNQPYDRAGVITYLCEAGAGHGLGPARAAVLWDKFQSDAVRVMRETPEVALSALERERVPITEEQAAAIVLWLDEEKNIEACKLELTTLLVGRGFPKTTIREAVREWGNQAANFIKNDPYRLMQFRGCGFKRADAMYLDLGLPPGKLKRQTLCAWYTIARNTDGHTWFPLEIALSGIKANISGAKINEPKAMQLAKRSKALSFIRTGIQDELVERGGKIWCAEGRKARNELRLAEFLATALAERDCSEAEVAYQQLEKYPGYRVGTDGSVWSSWSNGGYVTDEWKQLKTDEIKGGYLRVRLRLETQQYEAVQVSHLILETFHGPRPIDAVACHFDGNPENNRADNLRWDTRAANEEDKKRHGTHQTGSGNPAAKITEADARQIRELYSQGDTSTYKLADQFGISRPVVGKIVKGELWKNA